MNKAEQNARHIILPSEYAGFGADANPNWPDVPLSNRNRDAIAQLIQAVTVPVQGLDDVREVGPYAEILFRPNMSGPVPDTLDEVAEIWQEVIAKDEVVRLDSLIGHVTPHRQYLIKSPRAASLVHLYMAFAYRKAFRICAHCEATYAAGHKVTNAFCSEKCRARVADVARGARLARGAV